MTASRSRARGPWTGDEPWHGSTTGYGNHGCRCDRCRAAATAWARAERTAVRSGRKDVGKHGDSGYKRGCRCDICRNGRRDALRDRRDRARTGVLEVPQHGEAGYSIGCRCDVCGPAGRAYHRAVYRRQAQSAERDRESARLRSRYRSGDRSPEAVAAHVEESRAWRRQLAVAALPPVAEAQLLLALTNGTELGAAAENVGLTSHALLRRTAWDEQWAARLDAALMAGRRSDIGHGTAYAYRTYRCRCPECRAAHAAQR